LRKFSELPTHLIGAQMLGELCKFVLFEYSWLHAKISSGLTSDVIQDFNSAQDFLAKADPDVAKQVRKVLVQANIASHAGLPGVRCVVFVQDYVGQVSRHVGRRNDVKAFALDRGQALDRLSPDAMRLIRAQTQQLDTGKTVHNSLMITAHHEGIPSSFSLSTFFFLPRILGGPSCVFMCFFSD